MTELIRRDLSGIYIFDKFPTDKKRKPTCIEDCQQETRRAWCMSKNEECLRSTITMLADTFKEMTDFLHSEKAVTDEQRDGLYKQMDEQVEDSKCNWSLHELADRVDVLCKQLTTFADHCGVTKRMEEDEE